MFSRGDIRKIQMGWGMWMNHVFRQLKANFSFTISYSHMRCINRNHQRTITILFSLLNQGQGLFT